MYSIKTFTIISLSVALLTNASPLLQSNDITSLAIPSSSINERDAPCFPGTMTHDLSYYDCPKKNTLDSNGHCSAKIPTQPGYTGCNAYCEVRLTMRYGQEIPIDSSYCQAGVTCTVTKGHSFTVTNSYSISVGGTAATGDDVSKALTSTFDIGATYTYSVSIGYTLTDGWTQNVPAGTCGYWTFIPYMMESCGTLTSAGITQIQGGFEGMNPVQGCDKKKLTDTQNWCNTTPYKESNGYAGGEHVFVFTNCDDNQPWEHGQNPAYDLPGVSTARGRSPGTAPPAPPST